MSLQLLEPSGFDPTVVHLPLLEYDWIQRVFDHGCSKSAAALEERGIRTWRDEDDGSEWVAFGVQETAEGVMLCEYYAARDEVHGGASTYAQAHAERRAMRAMRGEPLLPLPVFSWIQAESEALGEVLPPELLDCIGRFTSDDGQAVADAYGQLRAAGYNVSTYEDEPAAEEEGLRLVHVVELSTERAWIVDSGYTWGRKLDRAGAGG